MAFVVLEVEVLAVELELELELAAELASVVAGLAAGPESLLLSLLLLHDSSQYWPLSSHYQVLCCILLPYP